MKMRSLMVAITLFLFAGTVTAQPRPGGGEGKYERLKEGLELTAEQGKEVKTIFDATREKMLKIDEEAQKFHEGQMAKRKEIMEAEDKQVEKLLNDSQKQRFSIMTRERNLRMGKGFGMHRGQGMHRGPGKCQEMQKGGCIYK